MDEIKMAKHRKKKRTFKIVGLLLLIVGFGLVVVGFVDFFSSIMGSDMKMPKLFWMFFIGFPAMAGGGTLLLMGCRSEIMTYAKNESVPVINEAASELGDAFTSVAHSFHRGRSGDCITCACGTLNKEGAAFCQRCGTALTITCPSCRHKNEPKAQFCNHCGKRL